MAKTELKKKESDFKIVGKAIVNDFTFKLDEQSQNNENYIYHSLGLRVDVGDGNQVYSGLMGGYDTKEPRDIYVHGRKGDDNKQDDFQNKFQVGWDERFDEDIIKKVGRKCYFTAGLEKDDNDKTIYKNFLHEYDFISYVSEHLKNDMWVNVSGNFTYEPYNSNVNRKKQINRIIMLDYQFIEVEKGKGSFEQITNEEDLKKHIENDKKVFNSKGKKFISKEFGDFELDESGFYAVGKQRFLFDTDSIGKKDTERDVVDITGYVVDYLYKVGSQKIKKNILFEQTLQLPLSKYGDKVDKILKFYFTPKEKNGTVWLGVGFNIVEGAETTLSSIEDLPEDLQEQLECGLLTEEEALARCTTGDKEQKIVFQKILTQNVEDANGDKQPVSIRDYDEYTIDDYVFYGDVVNAESSDNSSESNVGDDELDEFLDDLGLDLDDDDLPF
jgi:hypothetical protein